MVLEDIAFHRELLTTGNIYLPSKIADALNLLSFKVFWVFWDSNLNEYIKKMTLPSLYVYQLINSNNYNFCYSYCMEVGTNH